MQASARRQRGRLRRKRSSLRSAYGSSACSWGATETIPWKTLVSTFTQALADLGWIDGRNVRMYVRWTGGDTNRTRALAQELVGLQPDIIVTSATPATAAVQRETRKIPMVFVSMTDPVASGIVARLDRPSENVTGFANLEATLSPAFVH